MNDLYQRFKRGETLHVSTDTGNTFYAKPEHWEGILLGYTILDEQQKVVPGRYRKQFPQAELRDWFDHLTEVK